MPPKAKPTAKSKLKSGGKKGKGKAATKNAVPPPPRPGSQEEVVHLLKEQLSFHALAHPLPESPAPSTAISDIYKANSSKLRKSIHDYTEYQSMHEQATKSNKAFTPTLSDVEELELRKFAMALDGVLENVMKKAEMERLQPEEARSELLTSEQWDKLEAAVCDLEAKFLAPHKGFLTKKPQWMPKNRMILDGDDEEFVVRDFGARNPDSSGLALMPKIPNKNFYTGKAGNFSHMQNKAADKRHEERNLRKQLLIERDQLQDELDEKDRQIKELDETKVEEKEADGDILGDDDSTKSDFGTAGITTGSDVNSLEDSNADNLTGFDAEELFPEDDILALDVNDVDTVEGSGVDEEMHGVDHLVLSATGADSLQDLDDNAGKGLEDSRSVTAVDPADDPGGILSPVPSDMSATNPE